MINRQGSTIEFQDPYFPHGIVDLRYAISCDPVNEKGIRLRTNQKTISLSADSVPSRQEWVKVIRKVIFKAQNMGDSVKIAIPYSVVLDVEKSSAMDFSETIEVKVLDKEEGFSVDSYFFAYFHDLPAALDQIRDAVRANRSLPPLSSPQAVLDTTVSRPPLTTVVPMDRAQSLPAADLTSRTASGFRLTSLLRPFHDNSRPVSNPSLERTEQGEDFTHISKRSSASFVPFTSTPKPQGTRLLSSESRSSVEASASSLTPTPSTIEHTYPPSTPTHEYPSTSSWNVGVPAWLKGSSRRVLGGSSSAGIAYSVPLAASTSMGGVSEVYSSTTLSSSGSRSRGASSELGYSILETPETAVDQEMTEKFHTAFAFDGKEPLLGCTFLSPNTDDYRADSWNLSTRSFFRLYIQSFTSLWPTIHFYQLFLLQVKRPIDI
jgi:sterol 3beta-glucosyltransferase